MILHMRGGGADTGLDMCCADIAPAPPQSPDLDPIRTSPGNGSEEEGTGKTYCNFHMTL